MTDESHTTPLWVTFSSLAWHSDAAKVPGEAPAPEMLERWHRLRDLELVDRQRARRIVSRRAPVIRWPGETLVHAWRKIFGREPPELARASADALEHWDGGDGHYYRMGEGAILVLFNDGGVGISVEASHPENPEAVPA